MRDLNYTPQSRNALAFRALRPVARLRNARGATVARRPCKRACRCALARLSAPTALRSAQETQALFFDKKQNGYPNGYPFCLAEKERFELSRRLSRPTPLAGAPLRPLEYFSVSGRSPFLNLPKYYTKLPPVCQALFRNFRCIRQKISFV